jgi:hypothetical protein
LPADKVKELTSKFVVLKGFGKVREWITHFAASLFIPKVRCYNAKIVQGARINITAGKLCTIYTKKLGNKNYWQIESNDLECWG